LSCGNIEDTCAKGCPDGSNIINDQLLMFMGAKILGPKKIKPVVAVADVDTNFDFVWGLERESRVYGDIHL
jgi:hypothetical protein